VLLPLTGNTAWAGKTNRIAAAIAAEEMNAQDFAGGYKIELVFGDSQCEPRPAHDQAQRLISQEKVQLLIGEWSSASVAVAQSRTTRRSRCWSLSRPPIRLRATPGHMRSRAQCRTDNSQQREATLLEWDFKFESVAIMSRTTISV
jgi:hypothetical protein